LEQNLQILFPSGSFSGALFANTASEVGGTFQLWQAERGFATDEVLFLLLFIMVT
jgi:hypothetical protein